MDVECLDCGLLKPEAEFAWERRQKRRSTKSRCLACRVKRKDMRLSGLRECSVCKAVKQCSEFSPSTPTVLSTRCKTCANRIQLERKRLAFERTTHFTCRMCGMSKPRDEFSPCGKRKDFRCKACMAKRAAEGRNTEYGKFLAAKAIARRRNLEWDISREEYAELRSQMCRYCGFALPKSGVALDRIDPNKGYLPDNVVPCCWECNCAKGPRFTDAEMMVIGAAIAEVKRARQERSEPPSLEAKGWGRPKKYAYQ